MLILVVYDRSGSLAGGQSRLVHAVKRALNGANAGQRIGIAQLATRLVPAYINQSHRSVIRASLLRADNEQSRRAVMPQQPDAQLVLAASPRGDGLDEHSIDAVETEPISVDTIDIANNQVAQSTRKSLETRLPAQQMPVRQPFDASEIARGHREILQQRPFIGAENADVILEISSLGQSEQFAVVREIVIFVAVLREIGLERMHVWCFPRFTFGYFM